MENLSIFLSESKIFRNLSVDEINEILPLLSISVKKYAKDDVVVHQEAKIDFLGIVLTGELTITRLLFDGSETFLHTAGPTFTICIDVLCSHNKISYYTITANEESEIAIIPYEIIDVSGVLNENHRLKIKDNILTLIAHENLRKSNMIDILARSKIRDKIIVYLTCQKQKNNSSTFKIPYDRQQLADYLSVNRTSLSYELSKLRKEGLIDFYKNEFTILDDLM